MTGVKWLLWIFGEKWDHMYSLKGCKGSNIQGSAQLVDGGPDIRGSVQFGHELMFPSWKIKKKKSYKDTHVWKKTSKLI